MLTIGGLYLWGLGGVNVVHFPTERLGSDRLSSYKSGFSDFVFSQGLMDLPLNGGSFTWSNNRSRS